MEMEISVKAKSNSQTLQGCHFLHQKTGSAYHKFLHSPCSLPVGVLWYIWLVERRSHACTRLQERLEKPFSAVDKRHGLPKSKPRVGIQRGLGSPKYDMCSAVFKTTLYNLNELEMIQMLFRDWIPSANQSLVKFGVIHLMEYYAGILKIKSVFMY